MKLRAPAPASAALRTAHLPSSAWAVRALAVAEIAVGSLVLLRPSPVVCLVLAASFAALAVVAWMFVRNPDVRSCGCFGEESPPTWAHVALDVAAAAVAAAAATTSPASLPATVRDLGWSSAAFLAGVCCIVAVAGAIATLLPDALSSYRGHEHREHDADRPRAGRHRHARTEDALRSAGVTEGHPSLWAGATAGDTR